MRMRHEMNGLRNRLGGGHPGKPVLTLISLIGVLLIGLVMPITHLLRAADKPGAAALRSGSSRSGKRDGDTNVSKGNRSEQDAGEHEKHDDHEDGEHDDHEDGEHDDHEEHDGHDGEGLTLSAEERRNAGIVIVQAGPGDLRSEISMPGEVALNEDRVAHVVPLVGGIAREVHASVGDRVEAGEVLAVLESSDLGEAKLEYLTKLNEILCCNILVPRARTVHDNTLRLLAFLDGNPSLGGLRSFEAGEAGDNLKTLVGTYAELTIARQIYDREKGLHEKKIASEQDYLDAKAQYEKAAAEYMANRDSVAFGVKRELLEAQGELRAAEFEAKTSEQRLRFMGMDAEAIHALDKLVLPEEPCTDPDCQDCENGATTEERDHYFGNGFMRYEILSPDSGVIVERHIVLGEKIGDDVDVFTIADTKTVWVNLTVYLKDLYAIGVGDEVTIRAEHSGEETRCRVVMVSPTVDEDTRTATARLVLENADGRWRPGVFVIGRVKISAERVPVVVPKNAVQTIEGEQVVFVAENGAFEPVPVRTGRSDRERVEITTGLAPGTPYVAEGAFELKAKLVTSSLDSHAGHGH